MTTASTPSDPQGQSAMADRTDAVLRDRAQYWITRLVAQNISEFELDQLEAWIVASPCNAQAFSRERALWQDLHAVSHALSHDSDSAFHDGTAGNIPTAAEDIPAPIMTALIASPPSPVPHTANGDGQHDYLRWDGETGGNSNIIPLPAPQKPSPHSATQSSLPRRRIMYFLPMALAASIASVVIGPSLMLSLSADHHTHVGEVRSISLPDGTTAMLDSNSAIAVDYDGTDRTVRLLAGRAWFDVKHEKRPFMVTAMGGVTHDIGTGFEVRRDRASVEVGVTEGRVQLEAPNGSRSRILQAGERMGYGPSILTPLPPSSTDRLAAWRNGEILIENSNVESAIAEIARYHDASVWTLGDFSNAAPISGLFLTQRPDEALRTLVAMRDLRVTTLPGGYMIIRPPASK